MASASPPSHPSLARSLLPALLFVVALGALVIAAYDSKNAAAPPAEKRYLAARSAADNLKADSRRGGQRDLWLRLSDEFYAIYTIDSAWPNRPAALFRAAEMLEEAGNRARARKDYVQAAEYYQRLAAAHAAHPLADDALLRAAVIHDRQLHDQEGALRLLRQIRTQYPRGDMAGDAAKMESELQAARDAGAGGEKPAGSGAKRERPAEKTAADKTAMERVATDKAAMERLAAEKAAAEREAAAARAAQERAVERAAAEKAAAERLAAEKAAVEKAAMERWAAEKTAAARAAAEKAVAERLAAEKAAAEREAAAARAAQERAVERAAAEKAAAERMSAEKAAAERAAAERVAAVERAAAERVAAAEKALERHTARQGSEPAALTRVSWDNRRDAVQIVVELDRPAPWQVRMHEAQPARSIPARITLEMRETAPQPQAAPSARIAGSLLTSMRMRQTGTTTTLTFDVPAARHYEARVERNPFRIVLVVQGGGAPTAVGVHGRGGFEEDRQPLPEAARAALRRTPRTATAALRDNVLPPPAVVSASADMASQLGLRVQTVFLDAGHGGKDPGAVHNDIVEREVVLDVTMRVGRLLAARGLDVKYSRTADVFVPLSARPQKAQDNRADLFVSIHVNANSDTSLHGFETFYLDLARSADAARVATLENAPSDRKLGDMSSLLADIMLSARTQESIRLARDIQRAAVARLGEQGYKVRDGGTRSAPLHVLLGASMPAVLVETGYCTHKKEAGLLNTPAYRQALAEGIASGIMAYRALLQKP